MAKRLGGEVVGSSSLGLTGLPPTSVPTEHLLQIQKKLQALVASLGQLNMEIAMAPTLDWPNILSRYGTLVSQTYSLSSSLTSSTSTFLPAQVDNVHRLLEEEAKLSNYFMSEEAALRAQSADGIPQIRFTDQRNPLPKLAATPVTILDGDKTARLGEALRKKLDPEITALHEARVDSLRSPGSTEADSGSTQEQLREILRAVKAHDDLASRALRTWYHVRWRPDEDDQTYDFRMRLGEDDKGLIDDEDDPEDVEGMGEGSAAVKKGGNEGDADEQETGADAQDLFEGNDGEGAEDEDMEEVT